MNIYIDESSCKEQESMQAIPYVLSATDIISYKEFNDIVVTIIKELRSISGEFLVVNLYYNTPERIHFLQVCSNTDGSYELEICKEVSGALIMGDVIAEAEETFTKIYCHNRNNTNIDTVIRAFKKVLVDGKYPSEMDWVDITEEAKRAMQKA